MTSVKLLFFATLRDRAGTKGAEMQVADGTTVGALKDRIALDFPNLKLSMPTVLIAINREYAADDQIVPDGADVALFPPVSGG